MFIGLLLVASGTAAFAGQSQAGPLTTRTDPRQNAKMHIGPFFVTPTLSIERIGIDNNVSNSDGDLASDFVVGIQPAATVWLPLASRALITTGLKNGFWYYKNHPQQSSLDPGVSVKGELKLGRLVPFGSRSYDQARRRPSADVDIRVPLRTIGTAAGLAYQPQARISFEISASRTEDKYGNDALYLGVKLNSALNKIQQGVKLRVDRKLTSLTTVHVSVENVQDKFKTSTSRDSAGVRIMAGGQFGRRALAFGDAEIGYRTMKMAAAGIPSFTGVVANMSLTHQFRGASALTVNWARDANSSFQIDHPYYIANSLGVRMRQQLGSSFDGIVALDRSNSSYVKAPGDATEPHVRTKIASFDLGFRLNHGARLGLVLAQTWRTSDLVSFRNFSGLRAGVSFSIGF